MTDAKQYRGTRTTRAQRDARRAHAWTYAADVIAALHLARPEDLDIEAIAHQLDAEIVEAELSGAEGQLVVRDQKRRPLDLRARIRIPPALSPAKRRFSIAHELGHFIMRHPPRSIGELCSAAAMAGGAGRPAEEEANAFAAALLLPASMLGSWVARPDPSLDIAREIARTFSVAIDTAAIRLIELTPHACALVVCRGGRVLRVSRSATFRPFITHEWMPGPDSVVVEHAAWRRTLPKQERAVPARTWIEDAAWSGVTLIEQAMILPGTSDVLTLVRVLPER